MFGIKKYVVAATLSLFIMGGMGALAEELPKSGPLADGKLSKQELAALLLTAESQLTHLANRATKEYLPAIRDDGVKMPKAWMLMGDGETIRRLDLKGQVDGAPQRIRILMYRAAIKSVARRGLINAAAILYSGSVKEGGGAEALVIEHEHRLGVSANKVMGYKLERGEVIWGKPITDRKPFEWFYDTKSDAS